MTRAGCHALSAVALTVLWIAVSARAAESELRLITAPEPLAGDVIGPDESSDEAIAESDLPVDNIGPPGMLTPPATAPLQQSDDASMEQGLLPPRPPPADPQDLNFELCDPAADGYFGAGLLPQNWHLCDRLRGRFAWLHGPPLPLISERWNERTLYVGVFIGALWGDELVAGRVQQGSGAVGGIRLGHDFDDYWAIEGRAAIGGGSSRNLVVAANLRNAQEKFFDAELLFYPWTTTRFRPFLLGGLGVAVFNFQNETGRVINTSAPTFPIGIGFKYRHDDWVAFRLDFIDTIAIGNNNLMSNTNNLSLSLGAEFRLGGPRKTYWPWRQRWLW